MNSMKQTVRLIFLSLVLCGSFHGQLHAQTDTLSFLQITDTHLIFDWDLIHKNLVRPKEKYGEGVANFKQFFNETAKKVNHDFVTITGDIFDSYEVQRTDGTMMSFDAAALNKMLKKSKKPVYMVVGNHDIVSYKWNGDRRDAQQLHAGAARAKWIRDVSCFKNGTYYSQLYQVGGAEYRLIYLDDNYHKFPPEEPVSIPYMDKEQILWLKNQLAQSPDDIEIILMHMPFKADDPLLQTSELYQTLVNSTARLIVTGHAHKNMVVKFTGDAGNTLTQVQTSNLFRNVNNWRRFALTENEITVTKPGKTENELIISCK